MSKRVHNTNVDNLAKREAITNEPRLFWANEILFSSYEFEVDEIQVKRLDGYWFLEEVTYADCKEYSDHVGSGSYCCEVLNVTGHSMYEPLTKFLGRRK